MKFTKVFTFLTTVALATSAMANNNWNGFYIGLEAGQATTDADITTNFLGLVEDGKKTTRSEELKYENIGLVAGLNLEIERNVVVGPVLTYTPLTTNPLNDKDKADFGKADAITFGARAGYVVVPNLLASVSLGWTNVNFENRSARGYSVGAGIDYLITDNWYVSGQYRMISTGDNDLELPLSKIDTDTDVMSLGFGYKF